MFTGVRARLCGLLASVLCSRLRDYTLPREDDGDENFQACVRTMIARPSFSVLSAFSFITGMWNARDGIIAINQTAYRSAPRRCASRRAIIVVSSRGIRSVRIGGAIRHRATEMLKLARDIYIRLAKARERRRHYLRQVRC